MIIQIVDGYDIERRANLQELQRILGKYLAHTTLM